MDHLSQKNEAPNFPTPRAFSRGVIVMMTSSAYVVTHFNSYLCYFWTYLDHPYTKMTGLIHTFQKKNVLGHDVTDDVINVIYHVIKGSKLQNLITLLFFNRFGQFIHQNHGIEMKFWKKNWNIRNNHRDTLYDVISIISNFWILMKQWRHSLTS